MGLSNVFDTEELLLRAEQDLNIFKVLLYRRLAGEPLNEIWKRLAEVHGRRDLLAANVAIAALQVKVKGGVKIVAVPIEALNQDGSAPDQN